MERPEHWNYVRGFGAPEDLRKENEHLPQPQIGELYQIKSKQDGNPVVMKVIELKSGGDGGQLVVMEAENAFDTKTGQRRGVPDQITMPLENLVDYKKVD